MYNYIYILLQWCCGCDDCNCCLCVSCTSLVYASIQWGATPHISLASHFECIGQYTQKWMCEENVCMELRTNRQQWMTVMFSKWAVRWWRITENPHIVKQLITFIVWCTEQLRWRPICTMQILLSNKGVYWDSQHGAIIPSVRFSSNTSPCWSYWQ